MFTEFGQMDEHLVAGTVKPIGGLVHGIMIMPLVNDPAVVKLRDGGASGDVLFSVNLPPGVSTLTAPPHWIPLPVPIRFRTDIYVEQTTASTTVSVLYS